MHKFRSGTVCTCLRSGRSLPRIATGNRLRWCLRPYRQRPPGRWCTPRTAARRTQGPPAQRRRNRSCRPRGTRCSREPSRWARRRRWPGRCTARNWTFLRPPQPVCFRDIFDISKKIQGKHGSRGKKLDSMECAKRGWGGETARVRKGPSWAGGAAGEGSAAAREMASRTCLANCLLAVSQSPRRGHALHLWGGTR